MVVSSLAMKHWQGLGAVKASATSEHLPRRAIEVAEPRSCERHLCCEQKALHIAAPQRLEPCLLLDVSNSADMRCTYTALKGDTSPLSFSSGMPLPRIPRASPAGAPANTSNRIPLSVRACRRLLGRRRARKIRARERGQRVEAD